MTELLLLLAGLAGGALNSLAGGGSFIVFPALLAAGVPPVLANATNTFAALPGYVSGAVGFWSDISKHRSRLLLASRPAAEEVSDEPVPPLNQKPQRQRFDDGPREAREPRVPMEGGQWFMLPLGRKQRADPKWLLPMICKAGGVTRRDVGSIKIEDTETRFEISAEQADAFFQQASQPGSLEGGIRIQPLDGPPARASKPKYKDGPKPQGFEKKPYAKKPYEKKAFAGPKDASKGAPKGKPKKPAGAAGGWDPTKKPRRDPA